MDYIRLLFAKQIRERALELVRAERPDFRLQDGVPADFSNFVLRALREVEETADEISRINLKDLVKKASRA